MNRLLFIFLLSGIGFSAIAQPVEVKGTLTSIDGKPIANAFVSAKPVMTMSDENGRFSLAAKIGDTVRFSTMGFGGFRYRVEKAGEIKVQLEPISFEVIRKNDGGIELSFYGKWAGRLLSEDLNKNVMEQKVFDSIADQLYMKVMVEPDLKFNGSFNNVLLSGITADMIDKKGVLELRFVIGTSNTIERIEVIHSFEKEIDKKIINNLKNALSCRQAKQNGKIIEISCKMALSLRRVGKEVVVEVVKPMG